ncbi:sensor domain-containing diguanylate cyclase [Marinomonas ostreistagni]|uniref:GGDEF domain-containing protein n=1 Tax=Marinomonas ostreistagni TaxID=359209 RepID=UPI00195277DC|nr:diguanylate cyclase [Marinomonas ostreistagni]MBM6552096.1 diguanylate cyclase [Marinomonas ostreistagni]
MKVRPTLSAPGFHRIGVRLNIVLLGIISFFLIACGYGIWTLNTQAEQFRSLTNTYYDRAMLAAELSRDAELIATQAMEKAVTQRLGNIDANILQSDITRMFSVARNKLTTNDAQEEQILQEIDRLTEPYFSKLTEFYQTIEQQQRLKRSMDQIIRATEQAQNQLAEASASAFNKHLQQLNGALLLMFQADRPGLLARRQQQLEQALINLNNLSDLTPSQQNLRTVAQGYVAEARLLQEQLSQADLITLAAMRETRLYAQRLSSACYDFYLLVKQGAEKAALQHTQYTDSVTRNMAILSVLLIALIALAYWLIQHFIIHRLNHLSTVMLQHKEGNPQPIPLAGNDEITLIGQAFKTFVDATNTARRDANLAQQEAEQTNQKLTELNASLRQQSNTDELTQIANRRAFFHWLNDVWPQRQKYLSISILMIDIDWFKAYNDHYGHQQGDICLQKVVAQLKAACAPYNAHLARYGGEEFIVAVLDISSEQAHTLGDEILKQVEGAHLRHDFAPKGIVSVSIGVATQDCDSPNLSFERLISKADQALYNAKDRGRDQVMAMPETTA